TGVTCTNPRTSRPRGSPIGRSDAGGRSGTGEGRDDPPARAAPGGAGDAAGVPGAGDVGAERGPDRDAAGGGGQRRAVEARAPGPETGAWRRAGRPRARAATPALLMQ